MHKPNRASEKAAREPRLFSRRNEDSGPETVKNPFPQKWWAALHKGKKLIYLHCEWENKGTCKTGDGTK